MLKKHCLSKKGIRVGEQALHAIWASFPETPDKEWFDKMEKIESEKQKRLNQKLYDTVFSDSYDLSHITELLDEGADPIGLTEHEDTDTVLKRLLMESSDDGLYPRFYDTEDPIGNHQSELVELFMAKGMRPSELKPYDEDSDMYGEIFWFAHGCSNEGLKTMKLLLDNGLQAERVDEFAQHFLEDAAMTGGVKVDEGYFHYLTCGIKMIMLAASYPQITENSEFIRDYIYSEEQISRGPIELEKFRNYRDCVVDFDLTTCDNVPHGLRNASLTIWHKDSGRWKLKI